MTLLGYRKRTKGGNTVRCQNRCGYLPALELVCFCWSGQVRLGVVKFKVLKAPRRGWVIQAR